MDAHRTLPHSAEMEQGVLSSIMQDAQWGGDQSYRVLSEVAARITPDYFYVPAHKTLYESGFLQMWRAGVAIDLISFTEWLRDRNLLEGVGGASYVTQLINFVPTAANVMHYVAEMTSKMRRREAIADGNRLVRMAYAAVDDDEFCEQLQRVTNRLGLLATTRDHLLRDAANLLNGQMPPLPRVVVHYLLHQGSKMILGGTSKSNKTWALMDLAVAVATGGEWWGFGTNQSRVCYINLEIQEAFFAQRLKAIYEHRNAVPEEGWLKLLNMRGEAEAIEDMHERLTSQLGTGFGMIIIDPVYKVLGGRDENKAGDIATLLNVIEKIAVETGAAIVFAAHYSKGNQAAKESMDRIGGSGVFARDPDSVLTMTHHEEMDCFTVDATLRNLKPIKQFVVRWQYPLFARDDDADPQKLKGKGGFAPVWKEEDILEQMGGTGWRTGQLQERCNENIGMPKRTFIRHFNAARKAGKIVERDGVWVAASAT